MTKEKPAFIKRTQQVLHKIKQHQKPHTISILNKNFIVLPEVFSPRYFSDTEFFAKNVIKILKSGSRLLEIGPGCGVISVLAALRGARVVAIDTSQKAIKNTKRNTTLHKMLDRVTLMKGNIFSPLNSNDKFDIIFWNSPFNWVENVPKNTLERTVFDYQYQSIRRYVSGGNKFLKEGGRLLLGFSTTIGQLNELKTIVKKYNSKLKLLNKIKSRQGSYPVKFQLYEIVKK